MDFISSISFPNEPLISWTFLDHFCHHFWVGLLLLCCCTHPKVMTKMFKKCSTDQRFIRKINTTYKIHTLVASKADISKRRLFTKTMICLASRMLNGFDLMFFAISISYNFKLRLQKRFDLIMCSSWTQELRKRSVFYAPFLGNYSVILAVLFD